MNKNIFSFAILVIAGLIYPFFVSPLWGEVTVLKADIVERDKILQQIEEFILKRNELVQKSESFTSDERDKLEKIFPEKVETLPRIVDLETLVLASGLKLENAIQPEKTAGKEVTPKSGGIEKISFSLSVSGRYENFITFLGELSKSLSLYDVKKLDFSLSEGGKPFTLEMEIETNQLGETVNEVVNVTPSNEQQEP